MTKIQTQEQRRENESKRGEEMLVCEKLDQETSIYRSERDHMIA